MANSREKQFCGDKIEFHPSARASGRARVRKKELIAWGWMFKSPADLPWGLLWRAVVRRGRGPVWSCQGGAAGGRALNEAAEVEGVKEVNIGLWCFPSAS